MSRVSCRFCAAPVVQSFADLGMSPISNAFLTEYQLRRMEPYYPLQALVCGECLLVQLEEYGSPEQIFSDYAYFSSYSDTWLTHARQYAAMAAERFGLSSASRVVEIASNDGYLLRNFRDAGIPVLGIDPARNVADVAEAAGIPTRVEFFGTALATRLASEGLEADLLIGNNVLAHVPALNDFVRGMKFLLKPHGVITMEFPHLLRLIESNQFDTIYHEHFSYFSLLTAEKLLAAHGLALFDVEELPTHGGSLRIYIRHSEPEPASRPVLDSVERLRALERSAGLDKLDTYALFAGRLKEIKRDMLLFLIGIKQAGSTVVGYGAPAKGNTLLNYCGIGRDFLDYTVDRNPYKQDRFLPGSHIPVYSPDKIRETRPDYLFILPWNLSTEIMGQMSYIREWGGRFIIPIPRPEVHA